MLFVREHNRIALGPVPLPQLGGLLLGLLGVRRDPLGREVNRGTFRGGLDVGHVVSADAERPGKPAF